MCRGQLLYQLRGLLCFAGQKFAMLEMQTLIVNVLLKYHLKPITRVEDVVFIADMVLRPKTRIRVKFDPRKSTTSALA